MKKDHVVHVTQTRSVSPFSFFFSFFEFWEEWHSNEGNISVARHGISYELLVFAMAVCRSYSYREGFVDAVSSDVHRVFLMEDRKQMDNYSQLGIKSAIKRGRISNSSSDEVCLWDAIIILICETLDSRSRASSTKQRFDTYKDKVAKCEKGASPSISLDLNL